MRPNRCSKKIFNLMYNKLVECGSVTTYIQKDFQQASSTYLALRYYPIRRETETTTFVSHKKRTLQCVKEFFVRRERVDD
jgi:hypothetical protein